MSVGFDMSELAALNSAMMRTVNQTYPKEARRFLKDEANKGRRFLRANTKALTKKKTGNLLKGIDKGPVHKYAGDWQVRVRNYAPHAHLIEHGHEVWSHGTDTGLRAPGLHPALKTINSIRAEYPADVDKFVDELLEKGLML